MWALCYWTISTHIHLLPLDYKALPNVDQAILVLKQKLPLNFYPDWAEKMKAHVI